MDVLKINDDDDDDDDTFTRIILSKIITIKTAIASQLAGFPINPFSADKDHTGECLSNLPSVTHDEVQRILNSMPQKSSPMDFVPTSLLKSCADIFVPIICRLANLSFAEGHFPRIFKTAQVTPLIKKPGMDPDAPSSYRPISNLNTVSKILEKLFATRLKLHIKTSPNSNLFQSAYKQFHSTETALMKILNDIYGNFDTQRVSILVALDLSAAFDTLDHSTLLRRLNHTFGVCGSALNWIATYLTDRSQYIRIDKHSSDMFKCPHGVPQGSVLGPLLFGLYFAPISNIMIAHGVSFHQYADDTQLYIGASPSNVQAIGDIVNDCTKAVQSWLLQNGLCLNPDKSEAILVGTSSQLKKVEQESVTVADCVIPFKSTIKNLGVIIDSNLSFDQHIDATCRSAQFHIRALRHIRGLLSTEVAKCVAASIVGSRLDYCNGLLFGATSKNLRKLQLVQNTAARVVVMGRKRDHVGPVLKDLHWLPVKERITLKLATTVFKTLSCSEPSYLLELMEDYKPSRSLRSSQKQLLNIPRRRTKIASRAFSVAAPSVWNSIEIEIRQSDSVASFKRKLKTRLFESSFS